MPTQPPNSLAAYALTTLDQVKLWLGQDDVDTTQDDRLTWLTNAASQAVMDYTHTEFVSSQDTASPRYFTVTLHPRGYWYSSFGRYDLQSASEVVIDADQSPTGGTVATGAYQLGPVGGDKGVYRNIRVYTTVHAPTSVTTYRLERVLSVKGTWGWPAVPSAVEQATLTTVAKWFRRDQSSYSPEFGAPDPGVEPSLSLPHDARALLTDYRRQFV